MQKNEIISVKFDDYEQTSEFDPRVENIMPIIEALDFLQKEAKQSGDKKLYDLISTSFRMVILAFDATIGNKGNH